MQNIRTMAGNNEHDGSGRGVDNPPRVTPAGDRPKIVRRNVDGVLLLDKPAGLSSTQAMAAAKRLFRAEKAGHTGTLDPFATGLLPVCFGEATKFSRFLLDAEKSYRATLRLGEVSQTGDTEGAIINRREVRVTDTRAREVLTGFLGAQSQVPPMYSALKQDGVPLYKLARQGIEVAREPRTITISALSLDSLVDHDMVIVTKVSKGTYIRVLAEEIGEALGCGAHLTALRRTATGGFELPRARTLDELAAMSEFARDQVLLPAQMLCTNLPAITLTDEDEKIFCNGGWLDAEVQHASQTTPFAVFARSSRFLGVGEVQLSELTRGRPRLVPLRLMATGQTNAPCADS